MAMTAGRPAYPAQACELCGPAGRWLLCNGTATCVLAGRPGAGSRRAGLAVRRGRGAHLGGIPLTEHCYRLFWWHEGDVFRLLMSLQNVLDGCTWQSRDAEQAHALRTFVRSVTGAPGCTHREERCTLAGACVR